MTLRLVYQPRRFEFLFSLKASTYLSVFPSDCSDYFRGNIIINSKVKTSTNCLVVSSVTQTDKIKLEMLLAGKRFELNYFNIFLKLGDLLIYSTAKKSLATITDTS